MANHERIHLNLKASPVKNYTGGVAADDLPDEMIHRIQSFMNARLAARTTVLFRSWRLAWLTRPDLDFRDKNFKSQLIEFREFALDTLQRYEDSKLRIYSFRLDMETIRDHQLAKELIIKALKLGATNLTLRIRRWDLESLFNLPDEVLDSETLTGLSAHECLIDLQYGKKEVSWSNLKTLSLSHVVTYGDLFLDLILKCPSLEEITLDTTRSVWIPREPRRLTPSSHTMIQLHKLKSLQLIGLDSCDSIYRRDLWPKFPWLKELVIWDHNSNVYDWKGLTICSRSLELITLYTYGNKITNGKFDVPNIRKFKVVGDHLPQLDEFKTSSKREWESDIQIQYHHSVTVSWFSSLSKLLRILSPSRISLSVCMGGYSSVTQLYIYFGDGLPIPAVENLTIWGYPLMSVFLDTLFFSCDPKLVIVDARFMGEVDLAATFQQVSANLIAHSRNPPRFQVR